MFRPQDASSGRQPSPSRQQQAPVMPAGPDFLAVPFKGSQYLDLRGPIAAHLFSTYGFKAERDRDFASRLEQLQQLRSDSVSAQGRPEELRNTFIRYSQALGALQQHLPFNDRQPDAVRISFPWRDAFAQDQLFESSNVAYERAAVLFNAAALASQQALGNDLSTDGGIKAAARQFQEAAGFFQYLSLSLGSQLSGAPSVDVTPDCTEMLLLLSLAQAQECYFVKAQADRKSRATLARVAQQVSQFYQRIESLESIGLLRKYLGKVWSAHVSAKRLAFAALALQQEAGHRLDQDKCGEALACLQEAQRLIEDAHGKAHGGWGGGGVGRELQKALDYYQHGIQQALDHANQQNATLYFDRIPSSPPSIEAASLVNPITLQGMEAPEEFQQWFAFIDRLQPSTSAFQMASDTPFPSGDASPGSPTYSTPQRRESGGGRGGSVAAGLGKFALGVAGKAAGRALQELSKPGRIESPSGDPSAQIDAQSRGYQSAGYAGSSLPTQQYEQTVDRMIRESLQRLAAAEEQGRDLLRQWRLPDSLQYLKTKEAATPRVMLDQKQQLQGGAQQMGELFRQMQERRMNIQQELDSCEDEIRRALSSARGDRTLEGYQTDIAAFRQNLSDAMRADQRVDQRIADNMHRFEAMDFNAAASRGSSSRMRPAEAFAATLRGALQGLDKLGEERANLEKAFRWEWDNDEVLKGRSQGPDYDPNKPLREGLHRYEEVRRAVDANLQRQAELLRGIDGNMQSFGDLLQDNSRVNEEAARQFDTLLRDYEEVRGNLAEGQGFYKELQEAVQKLHREAGDYCLARSLESSNRGNSRGQWLFGKGAPWSALPAAPAPGLLCKQPQGPYSPRRAFGGTRPVLRRQPGRWQAVRAAGKTASAPRALLA